MSRGGRGKRFRGGVLSRDKNAPGAELDYDLDEGDLKELDKPTPLFPVSVTVAGYAAVLIGLITADQDSIPDDFHEVGAKRHLLVSAIPRFYARWFFLYRP